MKSKMNEREGNMLKYILCGIYVFFSVSGLTLIKIGSNKTLGYSFEIPVISTSVSIWSFVGIICYAVSFLLYLGVISKFDLGFIIPILGGIINILILLVACFVLKEPLTFHMILGAVIVAAGIVIMNTNK